MWLWLFKLHLWLASSREIQRSRGEKYFYGRLSDWKTCLTKTFKDWNRAESAHQVRREKPGKAANSIWQINYSSRNATCMILYIALDEYTYTSTSKHKKSKEPHFEGIICQPLRWSYWATPHETCPRTWAIHERTSSWEHSWCPGNLWADRKWNDECQQGNGAGSTLFRMLRAERRRLSVMWAADIWATAPATRDALLPILIPLPGDEGSRRNAFLCYLEHSTVQSTR